MNYILKWTLSFLQVSVIIGILFKPAALSDSILYHAKYRPALPLCDIIANGFFSHFLLTQGVNGIPLLTGSEIDAWVCVYEVIWYAEIAMGVTAVHKYGRLCLEWV